MVSGRLASSLWSSVCGISRDASEARRKKVLAAGQPKAMGKRKKANIFTNVLVKSINIKIILFLVFDTFFNARESTIFRIVLHFTSTSHNFLSLLFKHPPATKGHQATAL
ncbi:MAG: hypothetical protein IJR53_06630 [Bacteroidales bacterium]|nr:hypothetical protein [Bacteroidales bacterium]